MRFSKTLSKRQEPARLIAGYMPIAGGSKERKKQHKKRRQKCRKVPTKKAPRRLPEAGKENVMKIFTIIGGVNGCGKSSLTGSLKAERTDLGIIVDPDKLTAELGGDEYEGGKLAVERLEHALADGVSFTQETTLSGGYTRKLARRAREQGYYIRLYYIGLDTVQESLQRIQNRVRKGGHDIPRRDVESRFAHRFADVAKVLPYCDEARFFDNDNGFELVAEYRNGEILPIGSRRPQWLVELMAEMR